MKHDTEIDFVMEILLKRIERDYNIEYSRDYYMEKRQEYREAKLRILADRLYKLISPDYED